MVISNLVSEGWEKKISGLNRNMYATIFLCLLFDKLCR